VTRLRVLHLDSGTTWRGGQQQVLLLAKGQRARGHEPIVAAPPNSPLLEKARAVGVAVFAIPMRAEYDLFSARRLRARIRTWEPHLVHAHDARSHAIALIALLGAHRTPLIVTRRVPFVPSSARLKYGPRVAAFIAISDAVRQAMVSAGIEPHRIEVVNSGIELPTDSVHPRDWRAEAGWPKDTVVCGIVGSMTAEKGLSDLPQIVAALSPELFERLGLVLIGGRDDQSPVPGLRTLSTGFVDDVAPAIAGLDVLWHPSYAEGLGTAVIEAMAAGVPAVAYSVGGIPEVVEDGVTGLLVPPRDTKAFADAATRLAEDRELRTSLGAAARRRASRFTADAMVDGTQAVYDRLLGGNASR
jgi:glycosyltransferase involved in cell wall biosynthesis